MHPLRALTVYVIVVFVGAGCLSPLLWWLAHGVDSMWPGLGLEWLVDHPFRRYVHRCLLVLALGGLWPLTRALGCRTWESVGFDGRSGWERRVAVGFLAGLLGFVLLGGMEVGSSDREWKPELGWGLVILGAAKAVLTGAVVALIEETLFRGVLFGGLRPAIGVVSAMILSSVGYGIVHYFGKPETPVGVRWFSGFEVLMGMMGGPESWRGFMPGFGTLFLLGMLLAMSTWRDGNVFFAVGLHAGLVTCMRMRGTLTMTPEGVISRGDPLSGWLPLALAAAGVGIYGWWALRGKRVDSEQEGRGENI